MVILHEMTIPVVQFLVELSVAVDFVAIDFTKVVLVPARS